MADFCRQCAKDLWNDPEAIGDLEGISSSEETKKGLFANVICEGCGYTVVDHEGYCRWLHCPIHGEENKKNSASLADVVIAGV
jgi:hypothetical protein